jgi:RHS repeat-associated protein
MQMQLASNPVLSQPPLAAMQQLSEKPHLGFATKKTAWNPGPNVCNFTVTLGLQVVVVENGVRKTYSARYYNPATGRFMSRDPEDGKAKDPKTLHKYLYVGGDPVNWIDPRGRTMAEYPLLMQIGATAIIVGAEVVFTLETAELWGMLDGPPGGYPPHPAPGNCPSCGEPGLPPSGPPYPPGQQPPITPDPGTWPEEW